MSFSNAIESGRNPVYYLNRSYSYFALNNLEKARTDALKARDDGVQINGEYAVSIGIQ